MAEKGIDEDSAFRELVERMTKKYPDFPSERTIEIVDAVRATLDDAKVRDFVPVLAEREVKKRIKQEQRSEA
ncbi:three-helix bundle dimerization domain-containing protein [Microbacterium sp. ZW T2_14]|uniref:three-helix bundle dimerization domain-containing protein n=1 Tax=Microbacterium sp. ZW T2_14 TaxID=3378079 RepID=UPI0038543100